MKKSIIILLCAVIICWIINIRLYTSNSFENAVNYNVTVYHDGTAKIEVKNVNNIHQASDGTLTIEGGGVAPEFQYPQRQFVKGEEQ